MSPENRNPNQDPLIVEWNGSRAEIYDPQGLVAELAVDTNYIIYNRSDFATPIEKVQLEAGIFDYLYPDSNRALALCLYARMRLDRGRRDIAALQQKFDGPNGFVPHNKKDGPLIIETVSAHGLYYVTHNNGTKTLVSIEDDGEITVSNNAHLRFSATGESLLVLPPELDSTDSTETLKGFMEIVMRTADYASGLLEHNPRQARLKKTYVIGKEIKIDPKSIEHEVGKTALTGTTNTQIGRAKTIEELGLEIVEDKIMLDDIGGLYYVKGVLKDLVTSFQHPEIMEKWGAKRPQGVLLYGEPGTGKTMLARALSNELEAEMWSLQSTDIYDMWLGNSETRIKAIFDKAKSVKGRLVLFFDEFESVVGITEDPRAGGADNARNAVAGIFKQEMNSLSQENPNVLVVAATNDLDRIDPSLVRSGRFDYKVYVPMPDEEARNEIITGIVSRFILKNEAEFQVFADDLQVPEITELTDGLSGADITEIFRRVSLQKAMDEARTGHPQEPISQKEITQAILDFKQLG